MSLDLFDISPGDPQIGAALKTLPEPPDSTEEFWSNLDAAMDEPRPTLLLSKRRIPTRPLLAVAVGLAIVAGGFGLSQVSPQASQIQSTSNEKADESNDLPLTKTDSNTAEDNAREDDSSSSKSFEAETSDADGESSSTEDQKVDDNQTVNNGQTTNQDQTADDEDTTRNDEQTADDQQTTAGDQTNDDGQTSNSDDQTADNDQTTESQESTNNDNQSTNNDDQTNNDNQTTNNDNQTTNNDNQTTEQTDDEETTDDEPLGQLITPASLVVANTGSGIDAFWTPVANAEAYFYRLHINGELAESKSTTFDRIGYPIDSYPSEVCLSVSATAEGWISSISRRDCTTVEPLHEPPLSTPEPTVQQIYISNVYASWPEIDEADSYDYRITVEGQEIEASNTPDAGLTFSFGSDSGQICIHVTARSTTGPPPSSEGTACLAVESSALDTPNVGATADSTSLDANWPDIPDAESYKYTVTLEDQASPPVASGELADDPTSAFNNLSIQFDSVVGRICLRVTAHAEDMNRSAESYNCIDVEP